MDTEIGQRLKSYRLKKNVSMTTVAQEIGISRENLYKWERGSKPSTITDYVTLNDYLDKKAKEDDYLQSYLQQSNQVCQIVHLPFNPTKPSVQLVGNNYYSGMIGKSNEEPGIIVDRMDAPFAGQIEGAIETDDDSMEPICKTGARIAVLRMQFIKVLTWGFCYYIIDNNWQTIFRRIYPLSEESILLIADHPDQKKYPPIQRAWKDIATILKVKMVMLKL